MNQKLTEEISYHILANLGVLPAPFVNQEQTKAVISKQFLLPEKITLEIEGSDPLRKNVYGCQIPVANSQDFKLLLADCTQEKNVPEYGVVVQLKGAPAFGIYFIFNQIIEEEIDPEAMIAVNTDKKHWIPCTTYLQGTFLAGMEQLRDLGFGWVKCVAYQELYAQLLTFIKFHNNYFEVNNEGQEE
jgi:hypothetical protein